MSNLQSCFQSHAVLLQPRHTRTKAFTLIELLVVIAIIALLIGILIPALSKARESGRNLKCLTNCRSMGQSMTLYANDWKSWYPAIPEDLSDSYLGSQHVRGGLAGIFSLNQIGSKNGDGVNEQEGQIKRWEGIPGQEGDADTLESYPNGIRKPVMRDYVTAFDNLICPADKEDYYYGQAQSPNGQPLGTYTTPAAWTAQRRTPTIPSAEREIVGTNISYLYMAGLRTDEPQIPYPPPMWGDETNGKDIGTDAWYGASVATDGTVTFNIPAGMQSNINIGISGYAKNDNHGTKGANFVYADGHGQFVIENIPREFFARSTPNYTAQKSINAVNPNRTNKIQTID